jgi:DNA polymerase IV
MDTRAILHIDMDAFYASVEERDNPELKGTPLIVGGTGGRGVVAAASYAVRKFGVHSAMPMREALKRCPDAVVVRPRMSRYQEVSGVVFAIFQQFTPLIEGLSLDEAFLDVTASQRLLGAPQKIAVDIRARIAEQTALTASVGIAPNKLLAKIASDLNKPDGMCRIDAGNLREVLDPLPIQKLFGVGAKTLPAVNAAGLYTFGDVRNADDAVLWRVFGKHGKLIRDRACGIDDRPVVADREEKSISAEETYDIDIRSPTELSAQLAHLADRTASRLRAQGLIAGVVNVKIRRADFTTYTRQKALGTATQDTATISRVAQSLLEEWIKAQPRAAVRLLGVGVADLQEQVQSDLFAHVKTAPSRLDSAVDGIRHRFGAGVLTRASRLPRTPGGSDSQS